MERNLQFSGNSQLFGTDLLALEGHELLFDVEKNVPGSVQYSIMRFRKKKNWNLKDTGTIVYHVEKNDPAANSLKLRFCISGNMYCREKIAECDRCGLNFSPDCNAKTESVDLLSFSFSPAYLHQFTRGEKETQSLSDNIIAFNHNESFSRTLPLCAKTRQTLNALLNHSYTDTIANIYVNAQMQILLLYSMDCLLGEKNEPVFKSKFLANQDDLDKIIRARGILLEHIGEPLTIKALSRKVAINECYLKKGFKEIFGTTIFDFYQGQRMEHAKYLLCEKGLTVTEVSLSLGYSSISHFSTAFKKHTGIKPCELLLRANIPALPVL